jgi:hypothetical protein
MPEKKKFKLGRFLIRYLGACFIIFGLLVMAVGLPAHSLPFLGLGLGLIYCTTKHFKKWVGGLRSAQGRNPS